MIIEGEIIKGEIFEDVSITGISQKSMNINQSGDVVVIDKHQAAQLIEVLHRWVDGEEID